MIKIILVLTLLLNSLGFCLKGRDGNGGNEVAMRFTKIASDSLKFLKRKGNNSKKIDLKSLESAINSTQVYAVTYKLCSDPNDKICAEEDGFVAKNYPNTNEILINVERWNKLVQDVKIRIALHEYFGIMKLEEAKYSISSSIIIALDAAYGENYACQMSLFDSSYPIRALGSTSFVVVNVDSRGVIHNSPIKNSDRDVIFKAVIGKNYLRSSVEIALIDRRNNYVLDILKTEKTIFEDLVIFEHEPIGVKSFKKDNYLLQASCSHVL